MSRELRKTSDEDFRTESGCFCFVKKSKMLRGTEHKIVAAAFQQVADTTREKFPFLEAEKRKLGIRHY